MRKLREILNIRYGVFRTVQNIRSHESGLMQLADFLLGAISYYKNNKEQQNQTKVHLIERIIKKSGLKLGITNYSEKLNLFFIELQ